MTTIKNISKIVDIHSHILNEVDHGSNSLKESIMMLKEAKNYGYKNIVCTPHYNNEKSNVISKFSILKKEANKLKINLYLGNEIILNEDNIEDLKQNKALTINNTNYILVELTRNNKLTLEEVLDLINELKDYKIIFAHPELIKGFRKINNIKSLKDNNVLIQIDASSIYGKMIPKCFAKRLLRNNLVDLIASDKHIFNNNNYYFNKAYKYVYKKYGIKKAEEIFINNSNKVLTNKDA